ncbi:hypothetical protein FHS61_001412 [Altererythrobacter atlanticus]|nr:hypothetical protein [Croceibacterium atlanticum]MBB5732403.1 hypothetical protein [Croceibacterium atlanticum]
MSKQLAIASAFAIFALSALALFAPGSFQPSDMAMQRGATMDIAAPAISVQLPDLPLPVILR